MNSKTLLGSAAVVALLGLGMLAGSITGASHASAQTVASTGVAAPIAQTAAATATPGTPQTAPITPGKTAPNRTAPSTANVAITQQQAEAAALAASPGNTIDHTVLIEQNGSPAWDVDFTNGGGVVIDANSGAVLATEAAGTDTGGPGGHGPGGADQAALAAQATVTQAQAEAAALAASPGNTVDHSSLQQDSSGTIFWDVDFTNGGGVTIDAKTGAVIATEAAGTDTGGPGPGGHGHGRFGGPNNSGTNGTNSTTGNSGTN